VNFHLRNACRKLQVRGRRAAVAAAIRRGLLHPITA
ncbi:helix-turn-helix transcriptional regulator, partial [Burkholderia sp. SIMBA_048]